MSRAFTGEPEAVLCQPLLKWPGGKRELLRYILPLLPKREFRYFEPFLGGAAVFFASQPKVSFLSDSDPDLINCYVQVRDNTESVAARLARLKNTEDDYYKVRASRPRTEIGRAARSLYLATLSFNGIHRKNLDGHFNVPYGYKDHLLPCDRHKLRATSRALQNAKLQCADFERAVSDAEKGDVIYLDPPYTVAHGSNGFVRYNAKIFSWEDQVRLAEVAQRLARRGCSVVISNADHVSITKLYRGFDIVRVHRQSRIAASVRFRRPTTECIFHC